MSMRQTLALLLTAGLTAFAAEPAPKSAEPNTLTVLDSGGKEQKLKAWKWTTGVRRLGWLAPVKTAPKSKSAVGPEALAFRAEATIKFLDGVLTLLPLEQLHSLDYDEEMGTVTAKASSGPEAVETLAGTTKYKKVNKLVIEAEVDKGALGVAEVKYLGGYPHGIRGVRFSAPKAAPPPPEGRRTLVVSDDGEKKTTHKVVDLLPLYRLPGGGEKLLPTLTFKKTLKLDVSKIKKLRAADGGDSWQVTLKDGGDETLTLLETISLEGKPARLLGLVGRVPVGYKLFPIAAVAEITFDAEDDKSGR